MAARNWTPEQRQQQAAAIRRWKPWEQSTGPTSVRGKAKVAGNAYIGAERSALREAIKALSQVLKQQKCWLKEIKD